MSAMYRCADSVAVHRTALSHCAQELISKTKIREMIIWPAALGKYSQTLKPINCVRIRTGERCFCGSIPL